MWSFIITLDIKNNLLMMRLPCSGVLGNRQQFELVEIYNY